VSLAVTVPSGPEQIAAVLSAAGAPAMDLRALEVVVPAGMSVPAFFAALDRACAGVGDATVFVELPRDERRSEIIAGLPATHYQAKFRTGGVRADLYPDEAELAAGIRAVVDAGVPFKATAGLHHAVRNTDPETGFEQHGFLTLLLATDALAAGGTESEARALLAERDGATVAGLVRGLDPVRVARARAAFTSFGTCSITDPRDELLALGVLTAPVPAPVPEGASS
jgi:hypothetical protein